MADGNITVEVRTQAALAELNGVPGTIRCRILY